MPSTGSKGTWGVEKQLRELEKEVEDLKELVEQLLPMAQVYGIYKGHDNRDVPCVITNAFPRAGTVDIVVFDNQYSGGKTEITCDMGYGRNEAHPYLTPKKPRVEPLEEEPSEATEKEIVELVAH